ncbi:uncharacterized protein N7477_008451 [Penicillium maclennaniae]|uniref:uncharacterized protein n=1 Tax=Penicillium maclennaniae TaxID=1343394 RepID=UPI0025422E44|nr:uncharacterized protein N7477_008451 [Penicillium maclennaniae]KAJ5666003.1 hypothetical protein N7477_008451 [Penicillium maclennaniae]
MSANTEAPNAWEDEWETQADTLATNPSIESEKKVSSKVTKAQRRAQQAEFNRQLWAEADTPQTFHYLEARSEVVPLKQDIKPAVTLLSRKPQIATRKFAAVGVDGAAAGLRQLGLDGEEDDSDDESKPREPTFEERQAIALKAREEKQRKYEEVRERLFGSPSATTSGTSSPGSTTPPRQNSSADGRGKGKGRGGRNYQKRDSSVASNKLSRNLYDPSTFTRPTGPQLQRRERQGGQTGSERSPAPQQPTRSPRGPDGSGRGGFGFATRGARTG